jgi:hypothetical protein
MTASVFDGLKNAQVFERGTFVNGNGFFDLTVERMLVRDTVDKGVCFFAEFRVNTSTMAEHPVGSKISWCQKMSNKITAFSNLKPLFYAALGYNYPDDKVEIEKTVDPKLEQIAAEACDAKNPMKGTKLRVETKMIKTQKDKKDFTVFNWQPG